MNKKEKKVLPEKKMTSSLQNKISKRGFEKKKQAKTMKKLSEKWTGKNNK